MEEIYQIINNSEEINLLDYCYYQILIPNGVQINVNGTIIGPFDYPIIIPLTTNPYNITTSGGFVYYLGNINNLNSPITGDNYIISDDSQGNDILISNGNDDIIWSNL